jgi:6-pyruvoyltetrahydropterin/6-carboxytetrahydropterin synthase
VTGKEITGALKRTLQDGDPAHRIILHMFRLTREVRFAINDLPDDQLQPSPSNSFGGYPSLRGFGQFFTIAVTLEGELDPRSCYLRNIKEIDQIVRTKAIALIDRSRRSHSVATLLPDLFSEIGSAWLPAKVLSVSLGITPTLCLTQLASESPMNTRLSQKFEFSAAHRLHNPALSDDENRKTYGKCNNPAWHGHNYEVQVTLRGDGGKMLLGLPALEKVVAEHAIDKLDHKNLNVEVAEFKELIPTVENIAMVIYRMLKNRFTAAGAELASVTVWETPKTWCEYSE